MTPAEALALIEAEFEDALLGTQRKPAKKDLGDAFRQQGIKRPNIKPVGPRPERVTTRSQRPEEQGHIMPSAPDQKAGAQPQLITIPGTVQMWHVSFPRNLLELSTNAFREHAEDIAESLAEQGLDLGLNAFGPLEIKDRPKTARKPSAEVTNVREAAIVVYARGWKA